jgi:RNA polymerase sigma factor (sigma-70 family)
MTARRLPSPRDFRRLLNPPGPGEAGDAQLLQAFLHQGDESAFEALVWRHGPMVLGVCRRLLRDAHEAEDAFQASFLILARKAGSIGKHASLGSWLHKVAHRAALRARSCSLRRQRRERLVADLPAAVDAQQTPGPDQAELRDVLDEELSRLAEKYRGPVVLCCLEGLTNEEAARRLLIPAGTLKTRLARARELLAGRLAKRGLAVGAGLLSGPVFPQGVPAAVPVSLVDASLRGAVAGAAASGPVMTLTEGVLRAMMLTKLKLTAAALAVGVALAGTGVASYQALAEQPAAQEGASEKGATAAERALRIKKRIVKLQEDLRKAEEEAARERATPPRGKPIAVIFGDVTITRDELADHLFAQMRPEQMEKFLTRRILEHACRRKGITVTEAEVDAAMKEPFRGRSEQDIRRILRVRNQTLRGWREEVVRPELLLKKLARERSAPSDKDLRDAFTARYGERVECQLLIWPAGQWDAAERAANRLRRGEATFADVTKSTPGGPQVRGGRLPIGRRGTANTELEQAAFALKPGETSEPFDTQHGIAVLKCVRRIPADGSTRFEDVRERLRQELIQRRLHQTSQDLIRKLKAEARPRLLWKPEEEEKPAP